MHSYNTVMLIRDIYFFLVCGILSGKFSFYIIVHEICTQIVNFHIWFGINTHLWNKWLLLHEIQTIEKVVIIRLVEQNT